MSENKNVTLSDLANGAIPTANPVGMPKLDKNSIREANITEAVLPSTANAPVEGTGNPMLDKAFEGLDDTISRLSDESTEIYQKGEEQRIAEAIETDSVDDSDDDILATSTANVVHVNKFDDETQYTPKAKEEVSTAKITQPTTDKVTINKTVSTVVEQKPETVNKEVEVSAPVAGTKKEVIKMVSDPSVYDEDDDHLFDGIDEEDMHFLDDEDDDTSTKDDTTDNDDKAKTEEIKENIREEMNSKFSYINNKINLNSFTISKKPVSASKVINDIKTKALECADGVLYSEGRAVRMSAFKPMEIQSIDPQRMRNGNYNNYTKDKLKLIYDHIVDANKPKTFEAWAMITPNTVIDDYMFTAYKATFGLSNILTYTCSDEKCSNVFMDSVPIHSMIKFASDEVKEKYMNILHTGQTDSTSTDYKVDLYQASDEYVFALKVPSLYNTFIEPTLVDKNFTQKYEDLILLLSYIDDVYKIDYRTNELVPIDTKPVANDKSLSYKRRVKTYATILKSLTSDQLQALSVETDKYDAGKLDEDGNLVRDVNYVYPECRCPKCNRKIDEEEVNPDNMLFTRHQLGLMKKI